MSWESIGPAVYANQAYLWLAAGVVSGIWALATLPAALAAFRELWRGLRHRLHHEGQSGRRIQQIAQEGYSRASMLNKK